MACSKLAPSGKTFNKLPFSLYLSLTLSQCPHRRQNRRNAMCLAPHRFISPGHRRILTDKMAKSRATKCFTYRSMSFTVSPSTSFHFSIVLPLPQPLLLHCKKAHRTKSVYIFCYLKMQIQIFICRLVYSAFFNNNLILFEMFMNVQNFV